MPSLILIMEGYDRNIYPLGKATLLVGRRGEADIQLPCDSVSREHASIVVENEQFVLRDNGSANGSFVNGVKTSRSVLNHLDIVRFGNYTFLVNFQDGITEKVIIHAVRKYILMLINLDPRKQMKSPHSSQRGFR